MRAKRRHHLNRMKRKAKLLAYGYRRTGSWDKLYNHLAWCSCYICGNPRKHFKRQSISETMQGDWNKLKQDWNKGLGYDN